MQDISNTLLDAQKPDLAKFEQQVVEAFEHWTMQQSQVATSALQSKVSESVSQVSEREGERSTGGSLCLLVSDMTPQASSLPTHRSAACQLAEAGLQLHDSQRLLQENQSAVAAKTEEAEYLTRQKLQLQERAGRAEALLQEHRLETEASRTEAK